MLMEKLKEFLKEDPNNSIFGSNGVNDSDEDINEQLLRIGNGPKSFTQQSQHSNLKRSGFDEADRNTNRGGDQPSRSTAPYKQSTHNNTQNVTQNSSLSKNTVKTG